MHVALLFLFGVRKKNKMKLTVRPGAPVLPSPGNPGNPRIDSVKSSSRLSKLRMVVALHEQSFVDGPLRVNPSFDCK